MDELPFERVRIDRRSRAVHLIGRDAHNPRNFTLPHRIAARTGGNLASTVTFDGRTAIFFCSKDEPTLRYNWAVVLGGGQTDARVLHPGAGTRCVRSSPRFLRTPQHALLVQYSHAADIGLAD